jgi:hypothetical protein
VKAAIALAASALLAPCGFVDRQRVVAERFGFQVNVGDFGFARAAAVAEDDCAVTLEAFVGIDSGGVFTAENAAKKFRHRGAVILAT